ncbi:MAG: hypothetical protein HOI28_02135 [Euryarchaeota archaeon]|jgi:hypothetical protein|nr:hypothetical protein [Euryarchaeota archaeon]
MADDGALPKGLLPFHQLPVSKPQRNQLLIMISAIMVLGILSILAWITLDLPMWSVVLVIITIGLTSSLFLPSQLAILNTPLAVNLNHPFIDDQPIGVAEVYIGLSDGKWVKPSRDRLKLAKDELLGGYNIVEDNENYTNIGHFSDSKNYKTLLMQVTLINQALSLRDAVNEVQDSIEDARTRESVDSGLLDREWMEEEEIEISGPISKIIGRSE